MFLLVEPVGKVWFIMRRKLNSGLVVTAVVLAVLAGACAGPAASTSTTTLVQTSTTIDETTTTTTAESGAQAALRMQIDELIQITEEYRELDFLEPPTVTIVTDDELAARVRQQLEDELDLTDLARDTAVQVLLGLINPGVDLFELYTELYSEQVAGYYDGELKELVVPAGTELSELQKVTLVHELTHALTDQHFLFDARIEQLDDEDRFDELSALQAVIEGDASFTELLYVTELPIAAQMQIVTEAFAQDTTILEQTPPFIEDLLLFPYLVGSEFIQSLWNSETGFDPVNDAYLDPPTTTEQIYHPETYRRSDEFTEIVLPDTMLPGYEVEEEAVWGEVSFRVMFDQGLAATTAREAASGWGGDHYRVLWDGEEAAYVLLYEGDTNQDAAEMYDALVTYAGSQMDVGEAETTEVSATFAGKDFAYITIDGDQVLFIASSDPEVGPVLVAAMADPEDAST